MSTIEPRRCALRFKPPTLVLLYWEPQSGKQRRRSMPLRGISKDTCIESFANDLCQHPRHSTYFQAIPTQQLYLLLQKVKDACPKTEPIPSTNDAGTGHALTVARDRSGGETGVLKTDVKLNVALHHDSSQRNPDAKDTCRTTSDRTVITEQLVHVHVHLPPSELQPLTIDIHEPSLVPGLTGLRSFPPLADVPQSQGLLSNLLPLGDGGQGAGRAELAHLDLQDLLGPVVEEQCLVQQDSHHADTPTTSGEAGEAREQAATLVPVVQPTATFPTEVPDYDYSEGFSSQAARDDDVTGLPAEDRSLSFDIESVSDEGGVSGVDSEPDRHQPLPNSLSLAIPDICTGNNSEASENHEQDLNKVSEQMLAQQKEKMDILFKANRVQPGGEGWEYDQQQEFGPPLMEGGWDSDSSSTQEF